MKMSTMFPSSKMSTLVSDALRADVWESRVNLFFRTGGKKSTLVRKYPLRPNIDSTYVVLQRVAGKDASKQFWKYHNDGVLKRYKAQLQIGSLDTKKAAPAPAPETADPEPKPAVSSSLTPRATGEPQDPYGELIPFADPSWYQGVSFAFPVCCRFGIFAPWHRS